MSKPKVISLYSGAGGLDYGFEAAGFETVVAVEMDHQCCETLRTNRPKWEVIERDITQVPSGEILEAGGIKKGEAAVLVGGPPCQPFSKAGYWHRGDSLRLDDPRANTLAAYLRVLEDTTPQAFLLENVEGLAYEGKDEGLRLLIDAIEVINKRTQSRYRPVFQVLNAADHGVPQLRKRVFMIAARDGTSFKFPAATHAQPTEQMTLLDRLPPHRTAWDALADVGPEPGEDLEMRGAWADLLPSIPEGNNYLLAHRSRRWLATLRLATTVLVVLAQARKESTVVDDPGSTRFPLPLDPMITACRRRTSSGTTHWEPSPVTPTCKGQRATMTECYQKSCRQSR